MLVVFLVSAAAVGGLLAGLSVGYFLFKPGAVVF